MEIDDCIIVVDFETTCDKGGQIPTDAMEIIEIGAAKVNLKSGDILETFQAFVRPSIQSVLSSFCIRLTGIKQLDIDAAEPFQEVLEDWKNWLGHPFWTYASWGEFDRTILERCLLEMGEELIFANHINLKARAKSTFGLKKSGLAETLRHLGFAFEGRHHRALDDVINICKIVGYISARESELNG